LTEHERYWFRRMAAHLPVVERKIVAWWDQNVSIGHGGDRSKSAERGTCLLELAEDRLKVKNQQISRWRKKKPRG
jgi:hypothetical protein